MTRPGLRTTHTVAELEVSPHVYCQIAKQLREAGYEHCFDSSGLIDMTGIGLVPGSAALDRETPLRFLPPDDPGPGGDEGCSDRERDDRAWVSWPGIAVGLAIGAAAVGLGHIAAALADRPAFMLGFRAFFGIH